MRAIVVYESMFGTTEEVARAVADGLDCADLFPVDGAPRKLDGYDLLVVGAPTHAHGLSRRSTRKAAAAQSTEGTRTREPGMREWLGGFGVLPPAMDTAVFDTRLGKPRWLTGSAAHSAAKLLRGLGHPPAAPEASFVVEVEGDETKLASGEAERARAWGAGLRSRRQPIPE
ncbi:MULTISPECIES: flavodoxin domain-containing protein [Amycolatopsis]|uniref:Flavodoxin family protein n=1 Tax=Amycolatopsis dendrobii TaxID=2760662 RepID=A0A7W3Z8J4_9PSEU|nr:MULTISPECIES: flavodoxin domain-containing protein [Amycolatopsis]MBB1152265.1 flavodoxin family protein [Amycolatopsis dendrobii]UKD57463.1 flavodoxin domain-containing protein [Amycolatopsis sp. FU40]